MNPTPDPIRPEKQPEPERARPEPVRETQPGTQRGASGYSGSESGGDTTDLPTFDQPQQGSTSPVAKKKKKSWLLPVIGAVCLLGVVGGVIVEHNNNPGRAPFIVPDKQQVLTLCGADLDKAATDQAVADLKSGASDPLVNNLSAQVKQELLSGERMFYKVPMASPQADTSASAQSDDSSDRVEIDFNGSTYGVYNLTKDPISLDMPLKIGDSIDVKCLSVATGKTTLTVDLATVLNPVESRPLAPGDSEPLSVTQSATGQNYDWFVNEANQGNAVAQYGLGHMYQYGLGVAQDRGQAIHWYQMAAAQNYQDAQAQLAKLNMSP